MGYKNLKFPEGSKFLVTGSAGFIGSNLVDAILKLGYEVRGVDDSSTGKRKNVDELLNNSKYEFIEGDIRDIEVCIKACEGIDYDLNQAGCGGGPKSVESALV